MSLSSYRLARGRWKWARYLLSAPTKFVETGLVQPEMMPDLMQHSGAHLEEQFIVAEVQFRVRSVEDRDAVGCHTEVVDATLGEWYSFVQPEQARAIGNLNLVRVILNHDSDILHFCSDPHWKVVENCLHSAFECRSIHEGIVQRTRERPRWKETLGALSVAETSKGGGRSMFPQLCDSVQGESSLYRVLYL